MQAVDEVQRRWRWGALAVALCAAVLLYALLREVAYARTFPLVHDAAILHYVSFMIGRGHAPYLSQIEMNLPGTLMTESFSMQMFGADAAGLWRWDTAIGLCAVAVSAAVAGRGVRLAGACGAMLTWMVHLNDGAYDLGEREWLVALLLMSCTACAITCLEQRQPAWMVPCLALGGWASAIKPFAVLLPAIMVLLVIFAVVSSGAWNFPRMTTAAKRSFLWLTLSACCVGGLVPALATVLYFRHWPGSFSAFLFTEHTIGAWYAAQGNLGIRSMLFRGLSYPVLLILGLTLYLAIRSKNWRNLRCAFLGVGAIVGLVTYLAQHKGFPYHVYPMLLFTMVLGFVAAQRGLESMAWDRRSVGAALLLIGGLRMPLRLWSGHTRNEYPIGTQVALIADLQRLGGMSLNGQVQCLDMTLGGCIGALYSLHIEQPTGFVNDFMLFTGQSKPFLNALQQRFLQELEQAPPQVIVLSAHNWPNQGDFSFSKLERWPAFAMWLNERYRLEGTHVATTMAHTADYRIYVRR